jgi:hypothetical protein
LGNTKEKKMDGRSEPSMEKAEESKFFSEKMEAEVLRSLTKKAQIENIGKLILQHALWEVVDAKMCAKRINFGFAATREKFMPLGEIRIRFQSV